MSRFDIINYDNIANFSSVPAGGVVIPAAQAILGFEPLAGLTFSEAFTTDVGFTYNNTEAEFIAGLVRSKDQGGGTYVETVVELPVKSYVGLGAISQLNAMTITEVGAPRFILDDRYWSGAAWAASDDSYAQASSLADVNTNIAAFDTSGLTNLIVKVVFPAGAVQASVDGMTIFYSGEQYNTADPTIEVNSGSKTTNIISLEITEDTSPANTDISHVVCIAPPPFSVFVCMYWDGAAWVNSDSTPAQANTAADVIANITSLDVVSGFEVKIKSIMTSTDGNNTPNLTQMILEYDFATVDVDQPTCAVHGFIKDAEDNPVEGARVNFIISSKQEFNSSIVLVDVPVITDATGFFNANVIQGSIVDIEIKYKDLDSKGGFTKNRTESYTGIAIPATSSAELTSLIP